MKKTLLIACTIVAVAVLGIALQSFVVPVYNSFFKSEDGGTGHLMFHGRQMMVAGAAGPSYAQVVNTSLDSTIKASQIFCGLTPTPVPTTNLVGRGQATLINTGAEVWVGDCATVNPAFGIPLAAGTIAAPGTPYPLQIGPEATNLCCVGYTQVTADAGPAICQYAGPLDAGPGLDCPYDGGVCADGGLSCDSCSGSCALDGGPVCPFGGPPVYDGGCAGGGLMLIEIAR